MKLNLFATRLVGPFDFEKRHPPMLQGETKRKPTRNNMIPIERWRNLQECIREDDDLVDNITEVVPVRLVFVPSPANPSR